MISDSLTEKAAIVTDTPTVAETGQINGQKHEINGSRNKLEDQTTTPASRVRNAIVQTIISLILITVSLLGVMLLSVPDEESQTASQVSPKLDVETSPITLYTGPINFEVDGVVVPYREMNLSAQVGGRIKKIGNDLRVGSSVRSGDELVVIESVDYELAFDRLSNELLREESSVLEAEAEISRNKNEIKVAQEDVAIRKRAVARFESIEDKGVFSGTEIDQAKLSEVAARQSLQRLNDESRLLAAKKNRLQNSVALARKQLEIAKLDLSRTKILAPVDGVITQIAVEPNGYAAPGAVVVTIQDTTQMEVTCKLQTKQMQWIWEHSMQSVEKTGYDFSRVEASVVFSSNGTEHLWPAHLSRYDGAGYDPDTRMIPVRARVNNVAREKESNQGGPSRLLQGMFVKVRFGVQTDRTLLKVPNSAIQTGNTLWIVEQGKLSSKKVDVIRRDALHAIILDSEGELQTGVPVVISPLATPIEGRPVHTVQGGSGAK